MMWPCRDVGDRGVDGVYFGPAHRLVHKARFISQYPARIHIPQQDMARPDNDDQVCLYLKSLLLHLPYLGALNVSLQLLAGIIFNPFLDCPFVVFIILLEWN